MLKDGSVNAVPIIHIRGISHMKAITKAIVVIIESVPFFIIFIFTFLFSISSTYLCNI